MRLFYILSIFALLHLSCKKGNNFCGFGEEGTPNSLADNATKKAQIIWAGATTYDGCEWLVKMESGTQYHPESLDASFKQDGLNVLVTFDLTGQKFSCNRSINGPEIIRIKSIKK